MAETKLINNRTFRLILLLAGVMLAALIYLNEQQVSQLPLQQEPAPVDLTQMADTPRLVRGEVKGVITAFPEGFPAEQGALHLDGYQYVPARSLELQSTVSYISQKTLAENGELMRDYLAAAGFEITNRVEKPGLLFYYATRGENDLSIQIAEDNNQVILSASYLKR